MSVWTDFDKTGSWFNTEGTNLNLNEIRDFSQPIQAEYDDKGNISTEFLLKRYNELAENNKRIDENLRILNTKSQLELERLRQTLPEILEYLKPEDRETVTNIMNVTPLKEQDLLTMAEIIKGVAKDLEDRILQGLKVVR